MNNDDRKYQRIRAYKDLAQRVGTGMASVMRCHEESWRYKMAREGKLDDCTTRDYDDLGDNSGGSVHD